MNNNNLSNISFPFSSSFSVQNYTVKIELEKMYTSPKLTITDKNNKMLPAEFFGSDAHRKLLDYLKNEGFFSDIFLVNYNQYQDSNN
mgnify:CR=1 FL=1